MPAKILSERMASPGAAKRAEILARKSVPTRTGRGERTIRSRRSGKAESHARMTITPATVMELSMKKCSMAQPTVIGILLQAPNRRGMMEKKLIVVKMLMNWPISRVRSPSAARISRSMTRIRKTR
jgi:hypothetical protein